MIGIVVVSHDNIAREMVSVTMKILQGAEGIVAVAINSDASVEENRQRIAAAITEVDKGNGVLLLSDMFGGTPSNLCLSFLGRPDLEVVSGLNLPMLIKLAGDRYKMKFRELIHFIRDYGRKNIVIASEVLDGKIN